MHPTPPGQPIPQSVLDHYNASYNNPTYRVFRDRLQAVASANPAYGEAFIAMALNLLVDSALERSGAEFYQGAEQSLKQLLQPLGGDLVAVAEDHLANFGSSPDSLPPAPEETARQLLTDAQGRAEAATRAAGEIRSWRGHVAFAWASAAAYLLHAASAMLIESHYDSYPLEKFDKALAQLQEGVIEAQVHGVAISGEFVNWIRLLVQSRD